MDFHYQCLLLNVSKDACVKLKVSPKYFKVYSIWKVGHKWDIYTLSPTLNMYGSSYHYFALFIFLFRIIDLLPQSIFCKFWTSLPVLIEYSNVIFYWMSQSTWVRHLCIVKHVFYCVSVYFYLIMVINLST